MVFLKKLCVSKPLKLFTTKRFFTKDLNFLLNNNSCFQKIFRDYVTSELQKSNSTMVNRTILNEVIFCIGKLYYERDDLDDKNIGLSCLMEAANYGHEKAVELLSSYESRQILSKIVDEFFDNTRLLDSQDTNTLLDSQDFNTKFICACRNDFLTSTKTLQPFAAEMHYRIAICSESNGRLLTALLEYDCASNMDHPHAKARMEALQAIFSSGLYV